MQTQQVTQVSQQAQQQAAQQAAQQVAQQVQQQVAQHVQHQTMELDEQPAHIQVVSMSSLICGNIIFLLAT